MTNPLANISIGFLDSLGISALGFSIVFVVLIILMVVIRFLRSIMEQLDAPKAPAAAPAGAAVPAAAAPAANSNMIPAKGSLGEINLYDVDDKTAAMIMAIVADTMGAPLNELRFHSIREKK